MEKHPLFYLKKIYSNLWVSFNTVTREDLANLAKKLLYFDLFFQPAMRAREDYRIFLADKHFHCRIVTVAHNYHHQGFEKQPQKMPQRLNPAGECRTHPRRPDS